ncbi:MAG: hypothetical protein QOH69_2323 [Actinomycetota bacterium]|jgi:hypothetical protein|nr:hypothetical protein [Actinomycetota bacterium]
MSKSWSINASAYLARRDLCPRCDYPVTTNGRCYNCSADLASPIAAQIVTASGAVVVALTARQQLVDALPTLPPIAPPVVPPVATPPTVDSVAREGSQISVQSVLAIVGAALLAVAAIVFTFFNPDLTNFSTRTTIVAVTTVIFLGGAWLLARVKLQFSAEAIGALGMVFVALDVYAFSHNAPHGVSALAYVGLGTLVGALAMICVAILVRIRTWLWLGTLGLIIAPAWFGYAVDTQWSAIVGHLAVGFLALAAHELARRLGARFGSELRADRWMATVVEVLVLIVVVAQLVELADQSNATRIAGTLGALAILAVLSARNELPRFWSFAAGGLFTFAAFELVLSLRLVDSDWFIVLAPLSAAIAVTVLSLLTRARSRRPDPRISLTAVLIGSMVILLGTTTIAFGMAVVQYVLPLTPNVSRVPGLAATLGLAAAAGGLVAIWGTSSREVSAGLRRDGLVVGLSLGTLSLVALTGWVALSHVAQVSIALGGALVLSLLLTLVPRVAGARRGIRVPILIGIHLLVLHAAIVAWSAPLLSELGGAAVVVVLIAVTLAMPSVIRPVHTAVGFAYALIVFAHVLQLAHLQTIAIFCLTTTLASASALVVTLIRRVAARFWYAILIVTAVPFVIGIVDVLFERSGWTALSTGVTFALAFTLVVTNRPGLSRYLRGAAAGLLVPALAVVVVCLGAQVLKVSASPITLPIIAVIVACTLPSTELIGTALRRRGLPDADARIARLWIEISALITAGIAVILALVRAAAGLDTSLIVLVIIGLGAAATALITHRRYGWIVAAISWTGALWCFWGIHGVQVLEPYLLPPAMAAAIIGAISVLRKLPGLGLYSIGLACAALPSLVVLIGWGNGAVTPWRAYGLLAGAVLLVLLGAIAARRPAGSQFGTLSTPTLVVGLIAAAAGSIEAARVGVGVDRVWLTAHQPVTLAVLELSFAAAVIAAIGGRFLVTQERLVSRRWRWVYVPATLYLVIGPIAAVRPGWLTVWTLLGLTLVVLTVMVATAVRSRIRPVALPPVWFLFLIAWCTAVVGWSDRALRVEAFSLPLGLSLLAVGILAMRGTKLPDRSLNSWPTGFSGSWRLLTPGIVVTFLPSILATGTDPQTLRAILVIALALVAILIGSLRKLGAPFLLGIIVLPLENITVFAAQIGHTISATSWWITLATAGAVLLVIAVTYERRSGGERGVAARLRDLR